MLRSPLFQWMSFFTQQNCNIRCFLFNCPSKQRRKKIALTRITWIYAIIFICIHGLNFYLFIWCIRIRICCVNVIQQPQCITVHGTGTHDINSVQAWQQTPSLFAHSSREQHTTIINHSTSCVQIARNCEQHKLCRKWHKHGLCEWTANAVLISNPPPMIFAQSKN